MASFNSPPAEVRIDLQLVKQLVTDQHPDLAGLPVRFASEGWDNAQFQLGADLVVRLPRRQAAVALILNEQKWLATSRPWPATTHPRTNSTRQPLGHIRLAMEHLPLGEGPRRATHTTPEVRNSRLADDQLSPSTSHHDGSRGCTDQPVPRHCPWRTQ